jgi:hypothetical protein
MISLDNFPKILSRLVLSFSCLLGYSFAGAFDSARLVPVGGGPSAIAVGDFTRDGKLDMVVANNFDSSLSVLLGNGNGTFKPQTLIALDGRPVAVVVGDFNGDGILDVAALTTDVVVLLGNGDGTFRAGGIFAAGTQPSSLAIADFNHDGKLDLAVVESQGVDVLLGNGDGTFKAAVNYRAGDGPAWVATGDFNGDGKVDLVVSDFDSNDGFRGVSVLLGKGNGTFGSPIETGNLISHGGGNVVVGDFNGDGKLDVALGTLSSDAIDSAPIVVLFGDGTGKLSNPEYITTGENPAFVATGDFNADGKPDLIAVNSLSGDVTVLLGNGHGKFVVGPNYAAGGNNPGISSAAVGDFNGDGKPDLAMANFFTSNVSVLLNTGGGRFAVARDFRLPQTKSFVTVADFNNDGKEDLAVGSQPIRILFGKGNGTFSTPVTTNVSGGYPVTGDFTGDGVPDLATVVGDSVSVSLNKGNGTFKAPKTFFAGPNITWLAVGDFNNDGKLDLVVCADKFVVVLLGNGDGTFQSPKDTSFPDPTWELATGDFNGDGKLDVAVSNQLTGDLTILLGNGDGTFGKPHNFNAGEGRFSIGVGDFNSDGILDLAVGDQLANSVNVLLGNGDGTFGKAAKRALGVTLGESILTGDFNLDGKFDVAVTGAQADTYVLFGNGDGTLKPATEIETGLASDLAGGWMAKADFNRDNKPDLVVITAGGATILLNTSK